MTGDANRQDPERELFAYYGHHKCATQWIGAIMWMITNEMGMRQFSVHDTLTPSAQGRLASWPPYAAEFERAELRQRVDQAGADYVACHTADRLQAQILRPTRAFHVVRDPRDIVVSAYFSHREVHGTKSFPHMRVHREALRNATVDEGLLLEMEFSRAELLQIGEWDYGDESVLELKMEDVTRYPYEAFLRIFAHLGLLAEHEPVVAGEQAKVWASRLKNRLSGRRLLGRLRRRIPATGELVLGAVYAERFEAKTKGRERGTEDVRSHYRKGVAGDWINHFKPHHAKAFDERFGDLLIRLGYETSSDWVERV